MSWKDEAEQIRKRREMAKAQGGADGVARRGAGGLGQQDGAQQVRGLRRARTGCGA